MGGNAEGDNGDAMNLCAAAQEPYLLASCCKQSTHTILTYTYTGAHTFLMSTQHTHLTNYTPK